LHDTIPDFKQYLYEKPNGNSKNKIFDRRTISINKLWNQIYAAGLRNGLGRLLGEVENFNHYLFEDKKENVTYYRSPFLFYLKKGFEVLHAKRIDNNILKPVKIRRKRD
jgi:hypothetical protein